MDFVKMHISLSLAQTPYVFYILSGKVIYIQIHQLFFPSNGLGFPYSYRV
jgi:hypothetical protein